MGDRRDVYRVLVEILMSETLVDLGVDKDRRFGLHKMRGKFLTSWRLVRFSGRNLLTGVIYLFV